LEHLQVIIDCKQRNSERDEAIMGKALAVSESDMSKWDVDLENKLKAYTLLEWGTATADPYHVVMRVGYAISKREWDLYRDTELSPHQLQVAMSPAAAKELGAHLIRYAKKLEKQVPAKHMQN
jgi:hypothetical protein